MTDEQFSLCMQRMASGDQDALRVFKVNICSVSVQAET